MEHCTRFKCILIKNIFLIVEILDYCNYFDVFKYGLLYQPMVVVKMCLYFAFLSVYLLCLASHNANQFLPLLFQRKKLQIFIFLLLSCMLYLRCSARNLITGRSKSIKKKYMKEYFQKQRLVLGKMCKNLCRK